MLWLRMLWLRMLWLSIHQNAILTCAAARSRGGRRRRPRCDRPCRSSRRHRVARGPPMPLVARRLRSWLCTASAERLQLCTAPQAARRSA
ncbi:hypothetical protein T492DRAFT_1003545, partial [Pavlovales sp. CCMP2436]